MLCGCAPGEDSEVRAERTLGSSNFAPHFKGDNLLVARMTGGNTNYLVWLLGVSLRPDQAPVKKWLKKKK